MNRTLNIGVIGDFAPDKSSHQATNDALYRAARQLSFEVSISWLITPGLLTDEGRQELERFHGIWAAPGGVYRSLEGALSGIQFAREKNRPFFGT